MIEANPLNISTGFVTGRKMSQLNLNYAINGTYFNTPKPQLKESIWQIAIQDGTALGPNSWTNSYKGLRKGTMVCFTDGRVIMDRFNNLSEIKKLGKIKWAIGGNALYPDYNLKLEGAMPDIARNTAHTLMAYTKDKKILLLITKNNRSLADARKDLLNTFSLYSAINLDGGGSTSMRAAGKVIKDQGRKLNTVISVL